MSLQTLLVGVERLVIMIHGRPGMPPGVLRALLMCAALVLLLGAGADDDLERLMPDVEVRFLLPALPPLTPDARARSQ